MTCDRCGYAYGVLRIAVLVDGHVKIERALCADCRLVVLQPLDQRKR
jgi:hypothetical protein